MPNLSVDAVSRGVTMQETVVRTRKRDRLATSVCGHDCVVPIGGTHQRDRLATSVCGHDCVVPIGGTHQRDRLATSVCGHDCVVPMGGTHQRDRLATSICGHDCVVPMGGTHQRDRLATSICGHDCVVPIGGVQLTVGRDFCSSGQSATSATDTWRTVVIFHQSSSRDWCVSKQTQTSCGLSTNAVSPDQLEHESLVQTGLEQYWLDKPRVRRFVG